ncbi:MAG: MBL fold metallo-hydrolase [Bdellovibrionales bacterium]|nr:MBL fold metallo-hydrolase [Bdellovibrionales bacterium]
MNRKLLCASLVCTLAACSNTHDSRNAERRAMLGMEDSTNMRGVASEQTKSINGKLLRELPFGDNADFADAERGLIAQIPGGIIKNANGDVVWDANQFEFIKGDSPDTVNPSLWRQMKLVAKHGLFKVTDGIYQVRGYDLSNMSVIQGKTGWILIDPLISAETAAAGLKLVNDNLGKRDVVAVIYTHSHVDHYGGIRGVVKEADVKSGKVKIIAPEGFLEEAVSENVIAGNVMSRRASYMYGNLLPKDEKGMVGAGLGATTSTGTAGVIPPTDTISKTGQKMTVDGIAIEYIMAPGSEAPSEMLFYFPKYKAICAAEDVNHTMHNLYTLRGAKYRDGLKWSKYIQEAMNMWVERADVSFGSHHWPTWGKSNIQELYSKQRDLYRFMHDQTLRMANKGMTPKEIADAIKLPESLATTWANRGYYGSLYHDVRAQYGYYLGFFDGNPSQLYKLPPVDAAKRYVKFMGGAENVLKQARQELKNGDYRWVAEVVNHVVFAEPTNQEAKFLLADAYEQLGYQSESGPWRNFYLTGAKELREGVKQLPTPNTASPDTVRAMSTELFLDYMGVRLDGTKAAGKKIDLNLALNDTNEKFAVGVENGALHYVKGKQERNADATLTLKRESLNDIMLGKGTLLEKIDSGEVRMSGNREKVEEFVAMLDKFEFWFNIVTP